MLPYFLKISFRQLLKDKIFSLINILGLTLGLTCFSAIFLYVEYEQSFDRFHPGAENIYRIVKDFVNPDGTKIPDATTPPALSYFIQKELPEVESVTRLFPSRGRLFLLHADDKKFYEKEIIRVDQHFFDVFPFSFVKGDKNKALVDIHSVLLTESMARKYFGDDEPLGKIIRMNVNNGTDYTVTGVLEDVPSNAHFKFDFLVPFESRRNVDVDWDFNGFYTYARLKAATNAQQFETNVKELFKKNQPNSLNEYYIQPLTDIHLYSKLKLELSTNGDILYLKILMLIGGFIIILAGINYINLTTAQSARRTKEVGIRKVTGALRHSLVSQFMMESLIAVAVSLILSIAFLTALLPLSQSILGYDLSSFLYQSEYIKLVLPGSALAVWLLAGLYPALYLSSFDSMKVLRGNFLRSSQGINLRRALVIFQFAISSALIIGTIVVSNQLDFIQNKKLGFNKENIILLPNVRGGIGQAVIDPGSMIEEMKKQPDVVRIARADGVLGLNNSTNGVSVGDYNRIALNFIRADYDFIPALEISLLEGRNFSPDFISDTSAIIINARAAEQLGLRKPYMGQLLFWDDEAGKTHPVHVIGVADDFHFNSMREEIKPFGFILEVGNGSTFFVKVQSQNLARTLTSLEKIWNKYGPEKPFEYSFHDELTANLYLSEARFQKLFSWFTISAILIACLGLFGLITFLSETKTKEIGIRKVLGASTNAIVISLSKEFLMMVVAALLISAPISFFFMNDWLHRFAYHIDITWAVFALAASASIGIALLTISFQSIKAALANPVDSLRNE